MRHYFLSPLLVFEGAQLKAALTRALISPHGVYRVFEEGEEALRDFLGGKRYRVRLDGRDYQAVLERESGAAGVHYNLRFSCGDNLRVPQGDAVEASVVPESAGHLHGLLGRFGFGSPWRRGFARISAVSAAYEVPVSAVFHRGGLEVTADVQNFSYHGLSLLLHGSAGGEVIGEGLRLSLLTSHGRVLTAVTTRVARFHDEVAGRGIFRRELGLRIVHMTESVRRDYEGMILENTATSLVAR